MKRFEKLASGRFNVEMEVLGEEAAEPLVYFHGAGGLTPGDFFLQELGRDYRVIAPHLPGFGESTGGELIDDVIDAALFYHELMDHLAIEAAHLMGHSMGGMLAAEVAALDVGRAKKMVLVAPAGFWLDAHPTADVFSAGLEELGALLFHDPNSPLARMATTMPSDLRVMADMYVERSKRLGMASKFVWPLPDRGLKKRAYRIAAPTLLVWGQSDRVIPPAYAEEFLSRLRNCRLVTIGQAGHMVMYEQPLAFVEAVREFLKA